MSLFSSKTKNELEKLIEENDELKNTLHSFVQKHSSLTDLEAKIENAQKELSAVNNENISVKKILTESQEKLNELAPLVKELEEKKLTLESSISTIEISDEEITLKQQELEKLSKEHHELTESYQNLLSEFSSIQNDLDALKATEEKLRRIAGNYDGEIESIIDRLKTVQAELQNSVDKLRTEENQKLAAVKELDKRISISEEIKNNLENSVASIVIQLSEKEKIHSEFTANRENLHDEIRQKQKELDELEIKLNSARDTHGKLTAEISVSTSKRDSIADEIKRLDQIKSDIQDRILDFKSEEEKMVEAVVTKQMNIEDLEKRKYEIEENALKIETGLSQLMLKFSEELSGTKNTINDLRQEILEKEKELSAKEKILLEKTSQIAEYGGLTKVLQRERSTTEQLIANLKELYAEVNEEVLSLKEKTAEQKSFLKQLKAETSMLESRKETLDKELKQLLTGANNNYNTLEENRLIVEQDIINNKRILDELKEHVMQFRDELRDLRLEKSSIVAQKEEYSAKISELIALESSLKYKIAEHEKQLDNLPKQS